MLLANFKKISKLNRRLRQTFVGRGTSRGLSEGVPQYEGWRLSPPAMLGVLDPLLGRGSLLPDLGIEGGLGPAALVVTSPADKSQNVEIP